MSLYNLKLRKQMTGDAVAQAKSLGHELTRFYRQETQEGSSLYEAAPEHRVLAVCQKCGCQVELPTGNHEALYRPCQPDALAAAEGIAELVSEAPELLYDRLAEAAEALPADIAPFFDPGQFDTTRLCLLSNDGIWCLMWKLRREPNESISPDNPQSERGRVELYRFIDEDDLAPVTYTGPELDPNISQEDSRRRTKILYAGEQGLAHRLPTYETEMGYDRWLFRRLDGTRAYTVFSRFLDFHMDGAPLTQDIEEKLRALQAEDANDKENGSALLFVHEPSPLGAPAPVSSPSSTEAEPA